MSDALTDAQESDDYLRVGALRSALADLPDDMLVVMSKDGEGNGFSPLAEADVEGLYRPESPWSGVVVHPDDVESGDDTDEDTVACVVFWPTN